MIIVRGDARCELDASLFVAVFSYLRVMCVRAKPAFLANTHSPLALARPCGRCAGGCRLLDEWRNSAVNSVAWIIPSHFPVRYQVRNECIAATCATISDQFCPDMHPNPELSSHWHRVTNSRWHNHLSVNL